MSKKINYCVENEKYDEKNQIMEEYNDRLSDIIMNFDILVFGDGIINFDKCKMTTIRHVLIRYTAMDIETGFGDTYVFETGVLSGSNENVIAEPGEKYSRRVESKRKIQIEHYIHKKQNLDTGCLYKYPGSDDGKFDVSDKNITLKDVIIHSLQWYTRHERIINKGDTKNPNNCRGFVDSSLVCLFGLKTVNWDSVSQNMKC